MKDKIRGHRRSPREHRGSSNSARSPSARTPSNLPLRRSPRGHISSTAQAPSTSFGANTQRRLFADAHLKTPSPLPVRTREREESDSDSCIRQDLIALNKGEVTSEEEDAFSPPRPAPLTLGKRRASPNTQSFSRDGIEPQPPNVTEQPPGTDSRSTRYTGTTQSPTVYTDTTNPPSTFAGTTQPPETYAGTTVSPAVYTGTTQAPATYTGITQPPVSSSNQTQFPLTDNGTTQPPPTYTGTTQPPSTFAGTTQPPSTFAGTTQPPSTFTGTTQPPLTYTGTTQPPVPHTSTTHPPPAYNGSSQQPLPRLPSMAQGDSENSEEIERRKDLKLLFVHVHRVTVNHQKLLASAFNVAQVGNKKVRGARLFVVISGIMERKKKTALQLLEEKAAEMSKDFRTEYNKTIEVWGPSDENTNVPPISELEALSGVRQHPQDRRSRTVNVDDMSDSEEEYNQPASTNISLEEFARLMIIFRDHPEVANDLRRSGQDLTRQQLDINATRHAFWTERVERLFNDPAVVTNEQLDGPLAQVDPGRPMTTFRSGSCLQDLFSRFRKEFTDKYSKWDVSGNMDPETFVNFCRLPGQTTLTRPGARCLIAWRIFRFGTSQQNDLLLDFCSKEMAGASEAQLESGIGTNGESGVTTRRGRARSSGENSNADSQLALANALQAFSRSSSGEDPVQKKARIELDQLSVVQARVQNKRDLVTNFVEAKKLMDENAGSSDSFFQNVLKKYYISLAEKIERDVL